jgi:hypothetical protein
LQYTLTHKYVFKGLLAFIFLYTGSVYAQLTPKLNKFTIQNRQGIVYLDWTMSSGSVCLGITIEKSSDSINFKEVGSISGICGNLTKPASYAFQDENALLNQKIYYRLNYNGLGYSEVLSIVVINVQKNDYEVNPNPSAGATTVNFFNPKGDVHHMKILNLSGTEVMTLESSGENFVIESGVLEAGIYQFMIYNDSYTNVVNGRLIISR